MCLFTCGGKYPSLQFVQGALALARHIYTISFLEALSYSGEKNLKRTRLPRRGDLHNQVSMSIDDSTMSPRRCVT